MPTGVDWNEVANNVGSTLLYDVAYNATTMTVADGSDFPQIYPYRVTIWDTTEGADPGDDAGMEIVSVTNRTGGVLTIERAQENTVAIAHSSLETVQLLMTAGVFQQVQEETDKRLIATEGADGSVTVVSALQFNGATLQQKTQTLTITDGQITTIGAESAWGDVPTV